MGIKTLKYSKLYLRRNEEKVTFQLDFVLAAVYFMDNFLEGSVGVIEVTNSYFFSYICIKFHS